MREILPGIFHWSTRHEGIGVDVSSYLVEPAGVVIDPMVPEGGFGSFDGHAQPQQVVLTSGLHDRHAQRFAERFGIPIRTSRAGAERLGGRLETRDYADGEELAPGVTAIEVGAICPDEYALHVAVADGALCIADGLQNYGGALGFFPDNLLGDDPAGVKEGLKHRFGALLQRDFDHLLLAHGDPIVGGGKAALREFVTSPAGHEDFGPTT